MSSAAVTPKEERPAVRDSPAVLAIGLSEEDGEVIASAGGGCFALPDGGLVPARCRPSMVVVDEAAAGRTEGKIFAELRARPGLADSALVVLASSSTAPELLESCWRAGVDDCILRPLRSEQIGERLSAIRAPLAAVLPAVLAPRRGPWTPWTMGLVGGDRTYRTRLAELLEHAGLHLVLGKEEESNEEFLARAGALDLLLIVIDGGARGGGDQPSAALERARRVRAKLSCPVMVLSDFAAGCERLADAGVDLVDRGDFLEGILQRVNCLLKRPPPHFRAGSRVAFFCPVEFRTGGGNPTGPWSSGYSFNLSSGGIFVKTLVPSPVGTAVELRIRLPTTREDLDTTAVVAWANPYRAKRVHSYPVGMGVQFLGGASSRTLARLRMSTPASSTATSSS